MSHSLRHRQVPSPQLLTAVVNAPVMRLAFAMFTLLMVAGAPRPAAAQAASSKGTWTVPRTPDGQPDLRGMWVNFDSTPFEAPIAVPAAPGAPAPAGGAGVGPPSHWGEHDSPMKAARRSMVVDPPDGRVPLMKWAEDKRAYDLDHVGDHWLHQTPWDRCVTRGIPAGMFPAGYNNAYQFIQTPGYVVIVYEMIHVARFIPLDGRPHLGANIRHVGRRPAGALGRQRPSSWTPPTTTTKDRSPRAPRPDASGGFRTAKRCTSWSVSRRWCGHHRLPCDDRRPERLHGTVEGGDAADAGFEVSDVRIRVPRRQLRDGEHPGRRAGGGEEVTTKGKEARARAREGKGLRAKSSMTLSHLLFSLPFALALALKP